MTPHSGLFPVGKAETSKKPAEISMKKNFHRLINSPQEEQVDVEISHLAVYYASSHEAVSSFVGGLEKMGRWMSEHLQAKTSTPHAAQALGIKNKELAGLGKPAL